MKETMLSTSARVCTHCSALTAEEIRARYASSHAGEGVSHLVTVVYERDSFRRFVQTFIDCEHCHRRHFYLVQVDSNEFTYEDTAPWQRNWLEGDN